MKGGRILKNNTSFFTGSLAMKVRRSIRCSVGFVSVIFIVASAAAFLVPQLRWRAQVTFLYSTGQIPDLEFGQLVSYMMPGSDQSMTRLISTHNPYAVIQNYKTSQLDFTAGEALFDERCASCHGSGASGGSAAPALVDHEYLYGVSDWAVYRTIRIGVNGTGMPGNPDLTDAQVWRLVTYLRTVGTQNDEQRKIHNARAPSGDVSYAELAATKEPGKDWLTYSGSYSGTRHSALTQIDVKNVDRLRMSWIHQFPGEPVIEASPLVHDGVMYLPVPPCSVRALDAATGESIWTWTCTPLTERAGEHITTTSRGVALLDGTVYASTWDARLFALDAATGHERWRATVAEDYGVYFISGAPLALRNLVVSGVSTRQVGRGFIAAFDAETGEERWRFTSIPGPGEPGNETWAADSWKAGGGPMWLTGSYDVEEDLLYWGVGNPKPDYDAGARKGDNLYTNSVVAVRGTTGKLIWHFQFSPADDHDWDSAQIPVLVNHSTADGTEKRMLWANRNGYYYVLNRVSGDFLLGTPFVYQSWNSGLDANGRPILLPKTEADSAIQGAVIHPSNTGGTNWWSPAYDPQQNLMIIPSLERGLVFFPSLLSWPRDTGRPFYTAVRALDATSGQLVWEYRRPLRNVDPRIGGLLSVEGGVVFGSDQSTFFALDTDTGDLRWSFQTGGKIIAAPITYTVNGIQQVSIAAGGDLLTFSLPAEEIPRRQVQIN
jgi:alcohol dehydrogenase (cytochrome c)